MAGDLDIIKEELSAFAAARGPAALIAAKVLSVNETESTIEVELDNGATIDDVQLRSIVKNGDRVIVVPKNNSIVLIASINKSNEFVVVAVEEHVKIIIEKNNLTITITDKVKVEKGADNLKDAFIEIIEATEQIVVLQGNNPDYTKLATAKTKLNNILN